jgi:TonB family protein
LRCLWCLVLLLVLFASAARAQPAPAPPPDFVPPELVEFVPAVRPPGSETQTATVTLEILVDAQGATKEVKVVTSAGPAFDEAALAAAQRFTWKPGLAKGKPVPVRITYDYQFTVIEVPASQPATDPTQPAPLGTSRLDGQVLERGTRVPLEGAAIAVVDVTSGDTVGETLTDGEGRFVIEGLPAGQVRVVLLLSRYRRSTREEQLVAGEAVTVRYLLEKEDYDPYQTTVTAEAEREELERKSIDSQQAQKIPGTRGDVLRAVESFPGVARPIFGAGFLIIRGSNPEDTQTYFDGHTSVGLYHFGGLTSVVNSDLILRLDFLPGNFSAAYGRATGGTVAVTFREPRKDRWSGYANINLIDTSLLVEGPVGDGAIALAARRSYIDVILAAVFEGEDVSFTTAPVYWDYQALYARRLGGGRFNLSVFGARDALTLVTASPADEDPSIRGAIGARTFFQRVQATWLRSLGPATDLRLSLATGMDSLQFSVGELIELDIKQWFNSARAEVTHRPFRGVVLTLGLDARVSPFSVFAKAPRIPQEGQPVPPNATEQLVSDTTGVDSQTAIYAEAELDLGAGFSMTPGARAEYYSLAAEYAVDPRLTARWRSPDRVHTVRAGVGRYSQAPQPQDTDEFFGNPQLDPKHAIHYALGYDFRLGRGSVETTLFYKSLSNVITSDPATNLNDGAEGRVWGGELLVRWQGSGKFFGWLSYTYSRSERRDTPADDWRLFDFDQPHILTAVASYKLPWRMELGLRLRLVSGNPQTPILGSFYDADSDTYTPIPGEINSERLSHFQSIDVRLERRWVFDSWMLTVYLDIQNTANRQNPEGTTYSYDYRENQQLSGLPIIPSLGVKGEF